MQFIYVDLSTNEDTFVQKSVCQYANDIHCKENIKVNVHSYYSHSRKEQDIVDLALVNGKTMFSYHHFHKHEQHYNCSPACVVPDSDTYCVLYTYVDETTSLQQPASMQQYIGTHLLGNKLSLCVVLVSFWVLIHKILSETDVWKQYLGCIRQPGNNM